MIEYLSYILFFSVLIIFLIYIYIRLKYGFWFSQPVFHVYDLLYIFKPPGIIQHDLPEKNKYTNFKNIETIIFPELSELKKTRLVNFIRSNYLQNRDNIFSPQSENIIPYFTGHNTKPFVSFYNEENLMLDLKKGTMIEDKKIIGLMTSRPIHIAINNNDKDAKFDAYYVDYLCVDKTYRKKGIAPQIIQTHEYNQRHLNKNIVVSLFKREDELTGIVPLCVYSTYGFSVNKWTKPSELHASYKLLEINEQNFHFLFDFIKHNSKQFGINTTDNSTFIQGFKISFWKIAAENFFGFSAIEEISHNHIIIDNLKIKTTPLIVSPTAYFFYNFAYPTFSSDKVLIIN